MWLSTFGLVNTQVNHHELSVLGCDGRYTKDPKPIPLQAWQWHAQVAASGDHDHDMVLRFATLME